MRLISQAVAGEWLVRRARQDIEDKWRPEILSLTSLGALQAAKVGDNPQPLRRYNHCNAVENRFFLRPGWTITIAARSAPIEADQHS